MEAKEEAGSIAALTTLPCVSEAEWPQPIIGVLGGRALAVACATKNSPGATEGTQYVIVPSNGCTCRLWQGGIGDVLEDGPRVYFEAWAGGAAGSRLVADGALDLNTGTLTPLPKAMIGATWLTDPRGQLFVVTFSGIDMGPEIINEVSGASLRPLGAYFSTPQAVSDGGRVGWTYTEGTTKDRVDIIEESVGHGIVKTYTMRGTSVRLVGPGFAVVVGPNPQLGFAGPARVAFPTQGRTVEVGAESAPDVPVPGRDGIYFSDSQRRWHEVTVQG